MVDAVDEEVTGEDPFVLRDDFHPPVFAVEEKSVAKVFEYSPNENTEEHLKNKGNWRSVLCIDCTLIDGPCHPRSVCNWNHVPGCLRKTFTELIVEQSDVTNWVDKVLWLVYIPDVFLERKVSFKYLN